MTHDELLEELDEVINDFDQKYDNSNPYYKALRAVVELCIEGGYMPFDKSMLTSTDGISWDKVEVAKWEEVHGHDIRLKCYPEFGCQLLIDPRDILEAIEEELE
jgi:hypothetical protein